MGGPNGAPAPDGVGGEPADEDGGAVRSAVRAPEIAYHPARRAVARRGPADPVKVLMHRHRDLCERAVDPLEIAAGLEAHGLTDRAAARYRHRDVFSLAEELYARVPGTGRPAARAPGPDPGREATGWALPALLPGAACLATAGALRATEGVLGGEARFAVTAVGALLVVLGLRLALRSGPLRAPEAVGGVTLYVCWLLGYTVYGDDLLGQVISGGPDGHWTAAPAPLLGLTLALAPAAWCAHLFSVHARRRLAGSHGLSDFGAGVRPLLHGVVALFLCALTALLFLAALGHPGADGAESVTPAALAAPAALGVLLFLARLLAVHGFPEPAATGLAAACAVEVAAPFLVLAGRLPGLGLVARPVDALYAAAGPGGVPILACGVAAFGLLVHASVTLTRASAHATA
uniref:Integral membrane protein n=1 Tax=Streptomyces sp. NBC_01401 TaxID=2903854 RepID=A0AAU3GQW3_9ACTN